MHFGLGIGGGRLLRYLIFSFVGLYRALLQIFFSRGLDDEDRVQEAVGSVRFDFCCSSVRFTVRSVRKRDTI